MMAILRVTGETIVIPRAVADEIEARGEEDVTVRAVHSNPWIVVVNTPPIPDEIRRCELDEGEKTVLAWAMSHPGTPAILDDRLARRCATMHDIPVLGTVKLVLNAKQAGIVPLARPALVQLREVGLYLSDRVLNDALALVGE
jgi:predicted nucleic acid-binding protein